MLEQEIREYALDIGFDDVGYTTAEPFPQLVESLDERRSGYSWVSEGLLQIASVADPRYVLPSAKSIVVLIYDYYKQAYPAQLEGCIGKAYQSRLYPGKKRLFGSRLRLIKEFLQEKGMEIGVRPAMPERQAAVRAGVGEFGCNTFVSSPGRGSYIAIASLAVSGELEPQNKLPSSTCSDNCNKCIEACPTGALYAPFKMDPLRCIAFNTYAPGNFPGTPDDIPVDIREKMGTWIYGCDICQDACPHNSKRLKQKLVPDAFLEEMAPKLAPQKLLNMSDLYYHSIVQPILYGYMWEKKFLQRNSAIALGNTGDPDAVDLLATALEDPQEMVRAYTAWALGRIGGKKSKALLEKALGREEPGKTSEEMKAALALA